MATGQSPFDAVSRSIGKGTAQSSPRAGPANAIGWPDDVCESLAGAV